MQIILLSGGSGKRLWPLSNSARSKQFLPFLPKEDGGRESMLQRVMRQIEGAGLKADVTIATNKTQSDVILSQITRRVNMVLEPERRDTFPAIALACAHLYFESKCDLDETVVVMPSDPFTEEGYFRTIAKMGQTLEKEHCDMVLMGIKPTYPSPKFGYIVPEDKLSSPCKVEGFKEKPTVEAAQALIERGAVWNGGVFCFRLGYLMDILRKYLEVDCFQKAYENYGLLPKISFDYEVVEKASSIMMVPFEGCWKDLGTWNALAEEIGSEPLGKVTLGGKVSGVSVINELEVPLLVDGVHDVIIAAGADGMIVCGKKESEGIKDLASSFPEEPLLQSFKWGTRRVIHQGDGTRTVLLSLNGRYPLESVNAPNQASTLTVTKGRGVLRLLGESGILTRGQMVALPLGASWWIEPEASMEITQVLIEE